MKGLPKPSSRRSKRYGWTRDLAEPRAQLGAITSCFEWRWEEGAKLLKQSHRASAEQRGSVPFYAFQLLCHGDFAEAMISIDKCLQLDPLSPRISRAKGWAYYLERRFDQAIESLNMALALDERNSEARFLLGYAYLRKRLVCRGGRGVYAPARRTVQRDQVGRPG